MTVDDLIVRMVLGCKLYDDFGPKGGFRGCFVAASKIYSRTFSAARRNGLIEKSHEHHLSSGERYIYWKLTNQGALLAETLLASGGYWDSASEHVFEYLVPGTVITYGDTADQTGVWIARQGKLIVATAWELKDAVAAARKIMEVR